MPLPWKKASTGRISRLVTDLRSSSRGDSLVVQTGFPTSLIDLFVKNRDRLKKPSKKKKKKLSEEVSDQMPPFLDSNSDSKSSASLPLISASAINTDIDSLVPEKVEDVVEVPLQNGCFMIVLALFLLLTLALITKTFVVGVTITTFSLLLLECKGNRVFYFLRPCEIAQRSLNSAMERIFSRKGMDGFNQSSPVKELTGQEETILTNAFGLSESDRDPIEEIQIIESDRDLVNCERRLESTEYDPNRGILKNDQVLVEVTDLRNRKTKTCKIKAMMLAIKKRHGSRSVRNWKDQGQDLRGEIFNLEGKVKTGEEEGKKIEKEQGEPEDEIEEVAEVPSSTDVLQFEFGPDVIRENTESRIVRGSGCLTVLLILLAGLVGGRFMGLVLILGWCLLVTVRRLSTVAGSVSSLRINFRKIFSRRSFWYS